MYCIFRNFVLLLIILVPHLSAIEQAEKANSELLMLDTLIEATQNSLECQQALREQVKKFQEMQRLYLQRPNDKDLLLQVAKSAQRLLDSIQANYLTQAFEPEFLSELTLFSQVASKRGIPKP